MTHKANRQKEQPTSMENADFIQQGMRHYQQQELQDTPDGFAVMLGQLQLLAGMLAAGTRDDKKFAISKLKTYYEAGRRAAAAQPRLQLITRKVMP